MSKGLCSKVFALFLFFSVLSSCGKKDSTPPEEEIKKELSIDRTEVIPGDVITISTPTDITKESWQISLGGKTVVVSRFDARTAVLVVPYVSSGDKELDLAELGGGKKTIKVLGYSPVTNVKEKKDALTADVQKTITAMENSGRHAGSLPVMSSLSGAFEREFAKLSAQEQQEAIFILDRLSRNLDEAMIKVENLSSTDVSSVKGKAAVSVSIPGLANGQVFVAAALQYKRLVVATVACVAGTVFAIYAPDPLSKVLAGGAALIGLKMLSRAQDQIDEVLSLIFDHGGFVEDGAQSSVNPKLSSNKLMAGNTATTDVDFYFTKDIPAVSTVIYSNYLSFSQAFAGKTHASYKSVFENTEKLISAYAMIAKMVNKISSFFSGTPAMPAYANPIPAVSQKQVDETPFEKLSIANVSDKDIQLTLSSKNGKLVFTAKSDLTVERKFSFDLVYTDTFLGTTNKKTYSGLYNGGNPPDVLKIYDGDLQLGFPNQKLAKPIDISVADKNGQSLAGVKILWQVKSGNGTLKNMETVTDQFGSTKNEWTLGAEGKQQIRAILRKKVGDEIVDSELAINAFWNFTGTWSATEVVATELPQKNLMTDWIKTNSGEWKLKEVIMTIRENQYYKFREVMEKRDVNYYGTQTDSTGNMFEFKSNKGLDYIRFGGISGYRDYQILSFNPNEIYMEYLGAQPGTPGWSWVLNLWFTGNPGSRIRLKKIKD